MCASHCYFPRTRGGKSVEKIAMVSFTHMFIFKLPEKVYISNASILLTINKSQARVYIFCNAWDSKKKYNEVEKSCKNFFGSTIFYVQGQRHLKNRIYDYLKKKRKHSFHRTSFTDTPINSANWTCIARGQQIRRHWERRKSIWCHSIPQYSNKRKERKFRNSRL